MRGKRWGWAAHHATADEDALGRHRRDQTVGELRESMCDVIPDGAISLERGGDLAGSSRDGRAGREPFDAVAVKGAIARPGIAGRAHDAQVADLGVVESEDGLAADNEPGADAGSNGDIGEIVSPRASPQRPSASAAPMTSVEIPTGSPNRRVK